MRILAVGFGMPGPAVDNHTFANAPAFFDYQALVVEPSAVSRLVVEIVEGTAEHKTHAGERIVNGPNAPGAIGLSDLLRQRQQETERLLSRGGVVVCIAYPNAAEPRVAGFTGCDRYFWLPAPPGLAYREPHLVWGEGTSVLTVEHDHPFGAYAQDLRGKLTYHAYFDDGRPGFAGAGRVFARSAGGAAVGVELQAGGGRVVFLPPPSKPPSGDFRYKVSDLLQACIRRTLRLPASDKPPPWLAGYPLPGLDERVAARDDAAQALESAEQAVAAADAGVEELERYRRLLWQEGAYGLDDPVRAALELIGFRIVARDVDEPAEARLDSTTLLLEVDAGGDAVGMDGHHRLRRRLEEAIAAGKPMRGLLVINGYRTKSPAERQPQHDESLRIAAESMRYCVATSEQLFQAVRAALEGDDATVRSFRERLVTTEGILQQD
jgi:hypothetical protein